MTAKGVQKEIKARRVKLSAVRAIQSGRVKVHRDAWLVEGHIVMYGTWARTEHRRHVIEIEVARDGLRVQPLDVVGLLHALLVRVRVLLEALDAIFDFWPPKTRKERARLYDADMHDGAVKALRRDDVNIQP